MAGRYIEKQGWDRVVLKGRGDETSQTTHMTKTFPLPRDRRGHISIAVVYTLLWFQHNQNEIHDLRDNTVLLPSKRLVPSPCSAVVLHVLTKMRRKFQQAPQASTKSPPRNQSCKTPYSVHSAA